MKKLKCDLCDATAEGETFEEWQKALIPHYMQAHAEVMKENANLSDEKKKAEMDKWMAENRARFEAA
ncbi:hypothetical protein HYW53_02410 [Candidatus Giovannonibacteria bacterium]|nr:hypothetical protein [Candidatus Giovannonibacteria bacterium]